MRERRQRPKRRQLFCPAHPDELISGTGRKYFLHLLTPEELEARGMPGRKARLIIQAYPVLVMSNEWLEELFCRHCGTKRWCHVVRDGNGDHRVRWAPAELWQQVAHVDPLIPNPSVGEYTRTQARRLNRKRANGKDYYD